MRDASPLLPQRSLLRRLGILLAGGEAPAAPAPVPVDGYFGPGTRGCLFAYIVAGQLRARHAGRFTEDQLRLIFDVVVEAHESHYRVED